MNQAAETSSYWSPQSLEFTWTRDQEPQCLYLRVFLRGSVEDKFIPISLPQTFSGTDILQIKSCCKTLLFLSSGIKVVRCNSRLIIVIACMVRTCPTIPLVLFVAGYTSSTIVLHTYYFDVP